MLTIIFLLDDSRKREMKLKCDLNNLLKVDVVVVPSSNIINTHTLIVHNISINMAYA